MADTQSKIALITGASRGLGRNTDFGHGGARGIDVIFTYRSKSAPRPIKSWPTSKRSVGTALALPARHRRHGELSRPSWKKVCKRRCARPSRP